MFKFYESTDSKLLYRVKTAINTRLHQKITCVPSSVLFFSQLSPCSNKANKPALCRWQHCSLRGKLEQVGWRQSLLFFFFFQPVKTYLGHNNTSNRSSSRRWEASETFQSSKSVRRDMFLGMLSKDRAWWTRVMVGCALIEPSCQRNDWDHTLDGWPLGDDPKAELLVKVHHQG